MVYEPTLLVIIMSAKEVYNRIRLLNLKRAKLKQRQTELTLAIKNNEETEHIKKDIKKLEKEIEQLF